MKSVKEMFTCALLLTLLSLLVSLLHRDQGREVSLVICQHQRRTVASVGWHLQGQVEASKWDRCKSCKEK